jgi:H+/Cl- antiporter ClcA
MFANDGHLLKKLQPKSYKNLYVSVGALLAVLVFGDTVVGLIGHCLHVLFELFASICEHWLQAAFNLTERQAQILFFYLFTAIASVVGWRLSIKAYKKTKKACISSYCRTRQRLERVNWLRLVCMFTLFGTSMLLLT